MLSKLVIMGLHVMSFGLIWIAAGVSGAPRDHFGKEFIFGIPENHYHSMYPIMVHVTTPKTTAVHVEISTPRSFDDIIQSVSQFTVMGTTSETVLIHPRTPVRGTVLSTKAIHIKASDDIAVYCMNIEMGSNDGFIVYPLDALGKEYYTISYYPSTNKCQFMIVATENDTNVVIEYPRNPGINVTFYNNTFGSGDIQTITLQKYDVLQIQDNDDLTGTHITSDKNIAVLSGNTLTSINPFNNGTDTYYGDNLVEQLPPVNTWGKEFGFVATPRRTTGDIIKIVGCQNETHIHLKCSDKTFATLRVDAGTHTKYHTSPGIVCHVVSSWPIIVNLFVVSMFNERELSDPSFVTIIPFDQFTHDHRFITPHNYYSIDSYLYDTYFIYIINNFKVNGLRINGQPLSSSNFQRIPRSPYVGGYVKIPYGHYIINHVKPNVYFGGYLYGAARRESFMMATGLRLAPMNEPCEPTISELGDGIDNDCDGDIDEDICDDVDHVRETGDDCAREYPIHGQWSEWGNVFSRCYCTNMQYKKRQCNNPVPEKGGNPCFGDDKEFHPCEPNSKCRVDGGFSSWSYYTECSVPCGKGYKTRHRTCTNPSPKHKGTNCTGLYTETRECYVSNPCPIDGNWSPWKVSTCSKTCGNGTYYKFRLCDSPKPDHGGIDCIGEPGIVDVCSTMNCNDLFRSSFRERRTSMNSSPPNVSIFQTEVLEITIWILYLVLTTRFLQ